MATHQKKHVKNNNQQLVIAENGEEYAEIIKALGDCLFQVQIYSNGSMVNARLRGCLKGKNKRRVKIGDTILIQNDSLSKINSNYHIIHIYSDNDIKTLKKMKVLVSNRDAESLILIEDEEVNNTHEIDITDDLLDNI